MQKIGMILPQSLLGIILGAAILALILLPITFFLLQSFEPKEDVCQNPQELKKIAQVLDQPLQQEHTIAWHQDGFCRLVAFTPTQPSNFKPDVKWQQEIAQGGTWLCLCKVDLVNTQTVTDTITELIKAEFLSRKPDATAIPLSCKVQECLEVKDITQINEKPFSTWGLSQEVFLTFKKEGNKMVIKIPTSQEQEEEIKKDPLFV